jgi:tRNA modification GTPase
MDLSGLPVTFIDTAGLRDTEDVLESEGIRRARSRAADADLRILLLDAASKDWNDAELSADILVASKADEGWRPQGRLPVSAQTGEGLDALIAAITARLNEQAGQAGILSHARHRAAVERAAVAIGLAIGRIDDLGEAEFVAQDVRAARLALEGMIGRIDVEDVLGAIFGRFCIGK